MRNGSTRPTSTGLRTCGGRRRQKRRRERGGNWRGRERKRPGTRRRENRGASTRISGPLLAPLQSLQRHLSRSRPSLGPCSLPHPRRRTLPPPVSRCSSCLRTTRRTSRGRIGSRTRCGDGIQIGLDGSLRGWPRTRRRRSRRASELLSGVSTA